MKKSRKIRQSRECCIPMEPRLDHIEFFHLSGFALREIMEAMENHFGPCQWGWDIVNSKETICCTKVEKRDSGNRNCIEYGPQECSKARNAQKIVAR